jgi:hypothetical protein
VINLYPDVMWIGKGVRAIRQGTCNASDACQDSLLQLDALLYCRTAR